MTLRLCSRACLLCLALLGTAGMVSCKARESSGNFERTIAREVKQKITIGGRDWKNPIPDTPESQKQGEEHFQHHCMICHGLDGHSTGVPFAAKMDPAVPDLSDKNVQDYTDGQLKWIIQNGIAPSGMPSWSSILDDTEMWNVVNFIRHLPPPGSAGIPEVYQESEEQHAAATQKKRPAKSSRHKHTHKHPH